MKEKLKKIIKNKIVIIFFIILLLLLIMILFFKVRNGSGTSFDKLDDVKLEDVQSLYNNISDVSCFGSLTFDISVGSKEILVEELNTESLLYYMFNYLDKNNFLRDKMSKKEISDVSNKLFYSKKLNLFDKIKDFQYGDYVYNKKGNSVIRTKKECVSDFTYVSRLFGHTNDIHQLSLDVDIGKLVDGVLYDMNGKALGNYNGEEYKLIDLFNGAPYYRYSYVKIDDTYKLRGIKLVSRGGIE